MSENPEKPNPSRPAGSKNRGARRSGNQGKAKGRLPLVVLKRGGSIMRLIATLAALAVAALVAASTAAAGKPVILDLPTLELEAIPQHDCGDYELMLSGKLYRLAHFTVDDTGEFIAEHRQVRITGTIWNSNDPSKAAPYVRVIQIDWDYATGERAIIGTTRVVLRGEGNIFHNGGIRIEDWTDVDFETVFPTLIFQGGRFDSFDAPGWDRLCTALR